MIAQEKGPFCLLLRPGKSKASAALIIDKKRLKNIKKKANSIRPYNYFLSMSRFTYSSLFDRQNKLFWMREQYRTSDKIDLSMSRFTHSSKLPLRTRSTIMMFSFISTSRWFARWSRGFTI